MFLLVSTSVKHNHFLADSTLYAEDNNFTSVHVQGDRNVTVQGLDQAGCFHKSQMKKLNESELHF